MDQMRGIRMEGAQCRAPCLRGTCEAWGGPGWWTKGRVLSRVCVGFLVCFLIKKRRCNGGGGGCTGCVECVRDVAAGKEGLMMVGHQISMTNM